MCCLYYINGHLILEEKHKKINMLIAISHTVKLFYLQMCCRKIDFSR